MREIYQALAKVAPTDATVLLLGEGGTGKELAAKAIHRNSSRCERPFVAINCAALLPRRIAVPIRYECGTGLILFTPRDPSKPKSAPPPGLRGTALKGRTDRSGAESCGGASRGDMRVRRDERFAR